MKTGNSDRTEQQVHFAGQWKAALASAGHEADLVPSASFWKRKVYHAEQVV